MRKTNHAQILGLGVMFLTGSVSVLAQDSALEEVVVTATKRSVALQAVIMARGHTHSLLLDDHVSILLQ